MYTFSWVPNVGVLKVPGENPQLPYQGELKNKNKNKKRERAPWNEITYKRLVSENFLSGNTSFTEKNPV